MICEKCKKNPATVYYRESVNGKSKEYALCAECAAKLEKEGAIHLNTDVGFGSLFGDFDPMENLFASLLAPPVRPTAGKTETKRCTLCGSTFDDLVRGGKAGCPNCYEVFSTELAPTIRRIHGASSHTGRAPRGCREAMDKKREIGRLEREMKEAIKEQAFEKAAELRDQIRSLKAEGGDGKHDVV